MGLIDKLKNRTSHAARRAAHETQKAARKALRLANNEHHQAYKDSRKAMHDAPGATRFQHENGAKLLSGHSGIVPFALTNEGHIIAPGAPRKSNFKNNSKGS